MQLQNHDDSNTPDYNPWDLNAYASHKKGKLKSHGESKVNAINKIKGILMLGTAFLLAGGMLAVIFWGLFLRKPEPKHTPMTFEEHERMVNAEYEALRAKRAQSIANAQRERLAIIEAENKRLDDQERQERERQEEIEQLAEQAAEDALLQPYIPEDGQIMYIVTESPITWDFENTQSIAKGISAIEAKAPALISEKLDQCLLDKYKKTFPKETTFPLSIVFASGKAPALQPIQANYLEEDELENVQKCLSKSVSKLKNPFGKRKLSANIELKVISVP